MSATTGASVQVRLARLVAVTLVLVLLAWSAGQTLTVFAASSLTEGFQEIAALFEDQNPGARVTLSFAGSSTLSLQVIEGAPADVFASADSFQMQRVADVGLLAEGSVVFATNRLVVIAPNGSTVTGFTDLATRDLALVLAGPEVPVGRYARQAIAGYDGVAGGGFAAAVLANVVSEEQNVRLVVAKVDLGEADAGIVYATDAAAFPRLVVFDVPAEHDPVASYPIAVLRDAPEPELARAFVTLVLSPAGRSVLGAHGFGTSE